MNNKQVNYDICYIIDDQKSEEWANALKKEFIEILIRDGGTILKEEDFKRDFAYEIKHKKSGHYFILIVKTSPKNIQEFNRIFLIKEKQGEVIRKLIINLDNEKINKFKEKKVRETSSVNFKEQKPKRFNNPQSSFPSLEKKVAAEKVYETNSDQVEIVLEKTN